MVHSPFPSPKSSETIFRGQSGHETHRASDLHRDALPPWNEGEMVGHFYLEKLLGRGSSGFVYRVLETGTQVKQALKLLIPGTPEELVRNKCGFRRMLNVHHPGFARVHRMHRLDQYIGLTMEEVEGKTLYEYARDLALMPAQQRWDRLLQLTRQYAAALAHLHAGDMVHRDIKPRNLMVDSLGNGRIIDYGLVGTFNGETDPNGFRHYLVGSPNYLAPETWWDRFYMPASDVFSLGLSIFHVAQQSQGRGAVSRSDVSRQQDSQLIRDAISELHGSMPELLSGAIAEMLEYQVGDRPTAMAISRLGQSGLSPTSYKSHDDFFGRQRELAEVRSWVRGICDGGTGRLHIRGESGMGKTQLIDQLISDPVNRGWLQVFRAKCLPRDDQSLQAFDQIIDAIVARFMRADREPIEMDAVSAGVLHEAFPVLQKVIIASDTLPPPGTPSQRGDAMEAGIRFSQKLVQLGPMILVIDDVNYADRDSLNGLDALQSGVGEGFGIITLSRYADTLQQIPATKQMMLHALSDDDAFAWLRSVADRWHVNIDDGTLRHWIVACGGCPLDLQLIADELRRGERLTVDDSAADWAITTRPQLWLRRIAQLGPEATKTLKLLCVARGNVSYDQLGELTGFGESIDVMISELAHQRLIVDDVPGGGQQDSRECVRVAHAKIAESVLATLSTQEKLTANQAWANLLSRQTGVENLAARIAGHLFDAEEPGRATSYALMAAEDAEKRVAMTEAARWRERVLPLLRGSERLLQLRHTARCYAAADRPSQAARHYLQLAESVDDPDERIDLELTAITLMIRSGETLYVRKHLQQLSRRLGVPRPKTGWAAKLAILISALRTRYRREPQRAAAGEACVQDRQRLRICLELAQPMSMFDVRYATELNLAGQRLAAKRGDQADRLSAEITASVFAAHDPGASRLRCETNLASLRPRVMRSGDPRIKAAYGAAVAFSHIYAGRWGDSIPPVYQAIEAYQACGTPCSFEIAHTRWAALWANFKTGQIADLMQLSSAMMEDALTRSDRFAWLVTVGGYGAAAWLARDEIKMVETHQTQTASAIRQSRPQAIDLFHWLAKSQWLMYQNRPRHALEWTEQCDREFLTDLIDHHQIMRVIRCEELLRAELNLRWIDRTAPNSSAGQRSIADKQIRKLIRKLRSESTDYTTMMADYFTGRHLLCLDEPDRAIPFLIDARDAAAVASIKPVELAANDALPPNVSRARTQTLEDHLTWQGVVDPVSFARLIR